MLVPAGIPVVFSAVFFGASTSNVAFTIFDVTTTPTVVSGPTAMTTVQAGSFCGKFTFQAGKLYVIYMAVYTDGTFTALNGSFVPQEEAVIPQYLTAPIQGVIGVTGDCCGPEVKQGVFSIFLGDNRTMFLTALNKNGPLDLTNCTEIDVAIPNQDGTIAHFLLTTGGVVITQPPVLGKLGVIISSVASALFQVGEFQTFDVTFTISSVIFTVRFSQALSVFEVR